MALNPQTPLEVEDPRADLARRGLARSTSYQALHSALARLYRIDDFHMDRIGAGFFSEVFKVTYYTTPLSSCYLLYIYGYYGTFIN